MDQNKKELAWINKKVYYDGVHPSVLKNSIGIFSSKKPSDVMKKKNLNKEQYKKRFSFLSNCYCILDSGYRKIYK